MKKIVISALLAGLVSVASAQTVVTGALRYDFKKADGAATTTGITRSRIGITSTEDLGGGLSVTAAAGIDGPPAVSVVLMKNLMSLLVRLLGIKVVA